MLAIFVNFKKTHIWMIAVKILLLDKLQVEQTRDRFKHPLDHGINRQVRANVFLRNDVTLLPQLFGVIAHIPGLQIVGVVVVFGKLLQFRYFALRLRLGFFRQIIKKFQYLSG